MDRGVSTYVEQDVRFVGPIDLPRVVDDLIPPGHKARQARGIGVDPYYRHGFTRTHVCSSSVSDHAISIAVMYGMGTDPNDIFYVQYDWSWLLNVWTVQVTTMTRSTLESMFVGMLAMMDYAHDALNVRSFICDHADRRIAEISDEEIEMMDDLHGTLDLTRFMESDEDF